MDRGPARLGIKGEANEKGSYFVIPEHVIRNTRDSISRNTPARTAADTIFPPNEYSSSKVAPRRVLRRVPVTFLGTENTLLSYM